MEKLQGTSMDIVQDNIEKLKQIFPEIFTEGKIDFQVLKQLLGEHIENDKERYSFTWKGKTQARQIAQDMSTGTLRPDKDNSKDWENTENLYIEGDNLEVLKLLQKSYHGKIKMIYIDPPYNTGKDFVYKDNFKDNLKNYLDITGQIGEEGQKLTTNSDTNGRYHSDWLNMMYPRLKLARNLLTDDGVIFISIDDNEQENLKKICDEIFGEENFQGMVVRNTGTPTGGGNRSIVNEIDLILIYSKTKNCVINGVPLTEDEKKIYDREDKFGRYLVRSLRRTGGEDRREDRPTMFYPIVAPNGEEIYPIGPTGYESRWICGKEKYEELKKENLIEFQYNEKENKWQVMQKFYLEGRLKQPSNLWKNIEGNKKGTREIRELFDGNKIFDFPKPVQLILYALQLITSSSDIILDFFSGSATTAHAVMQLNAEDGGNRKYIMVQLPEVCDEKSEAYKAGYKNICEIGKERIRRAGEKIKSDETLPAENREKLDIGFKVFKLDSSNIKEWDSETENLEQSLFDSIDNIKSDRTSLDILYEILLKYGLDLNVPIVENKHFYSIGGGTLLISLDKEIDMEVIDSICEEYKTLLEIDEDFKTTVVFRDSSFANDVDKTNAMKKLEQVGIKEVRSI
ncbi:site-specific DNA-methyltransferase [Fusobacterium mortiferum]|uniref:site-specific DNA-methyltransferase n=1 Tax=Fusobacterium mortiferum TaxID=850 RepID=UPI003FEF6621